MIYIGLAIIAVYLGIGAVFTLVMSKSGMGSAPTLGERIKCALTWPRYFIGRG